MSTLTTQTPNPEASAVLDQKLGEIEQVLKGEAEIIASRMRRFGDIADETRDDALVNLSPAPLPSSWHIEGDPAPRMKFTSCSDDGGLLSGIWTCRPATFQFNYTSFDETVHVIRGVAEVRIGHEVTHLRAGSVAHFPRGTRSEWTVHEPIHKYFVQRNRSRGVRKVAKFFNLFRRSQPGSLG